MRHRQILSLNCAALVVSDQALRLTTNSTAIQGWLTELYCRARHRLSSRSPTALEPGHLLNLVLPQPTCDVTGGRYYEGGMTDLGETKGSPQRRCCTSVRVVRKLPVVAPLTFTGFAALSGP